MGILDRISTLLKSNVNAAIDAMSDPGREIEQLILDMETQTRRAREEVTKTLAVEKRCKQRLDELGRSVEEWQARAGRAVQAGDDALAKEALVRSQEIEVERAAADRAFVEQKTYVDQLTAALRSLEQRLKEVKLRKETLKAQARAQKDQRTGASTSAFERYEQLETKVDVIEAEAALDDELAKVRHEDAHSREVERKLGELDHKNDIEDRLAALKAKLDKKE